MYGLADGINNNGDIVGYWIHNGIGDVFLYSGGVMHDLTSLISPSSGWVFQDAEAINSSGQITGAGMIGGQQHAFLYSAGTVADLGTLPGAISYVGHALNASGQVVGEADFPDGSRHAFLYSNGSMHDLGPGWATGINASGEVVGNSIVNGGERPFVYIGGTKYDLNSLVTPSMASQVKIFEATAINDSGQIAGTGAFAGSFVTTRCSHEPHARAQQPHARLSRLHRPCRLGLATAETVNAVNSRPTVTEDAVKAGNNPMSPARLQQELA